MSSEFDQYFGVSNSSICMSEGHAGRCGKECPVFQMRECDEQDEWDDNFILELVNKIKKEIPLFPLIYDDNEIFKNNLVINECNDFHEDIIDEIREKDSSLNLLFFKYYKKVFNLDK